jgi:hypothetical protein
MVIFRDMKYTVDTLKVQINIFLYIHIFIISFYAFNVSNFVFYIPEDGHMLAETCRSLCKENKPVPVQTITGPEVTRSLRLLDFETVFT